MTSETHRPGHIIQPVLNHVAWEITRSCNLLCSHCRASAHRGGYEGELTTEECFRVIDEIAEVAKPMLVLTGGEPLLRPDVLDIGRYAANKGFRVVMGTNGTLLTAEMAAKLKEVPVMCVGVSLDFPSAARHDEFRCMVGGFEGAMSGIKNARQAGIDIQINSTISKMNVAYLDELISLALEIGAKSFHPFLLVPTGRGKDIEASELSPEEYEQTLNHILDKTAELRGKLAMRPICAPHFMRITRQRQKISGEAAPAASPSVRPAAAGGHPGGHPAFSRGCLSGTGFCFISHTGSVQGCGYLDIEAGNVKQQTFGQIWNNSGLFGNLRDLSALKGKCGVCEYSRICGGCRARAYEATGDCLEAEPYCVYEPVAQRRAAGR
ncbi:MAG: radical SAM protein [Chloroflexi bacterium]|nr:radical SAM protein [Chloroflexota bacterium]